MEIAFGIFAFLFIAYCILMIVCPFEIVIVRKLVVEVKGQKDRSDNFIARKTIG